MDVGGGIVTVYGLRMAGGALNELDAECEEAHWQI